MSFVLDALKKAELAREHGSGEHKKTLLFKRDVQQPDSDRPFVLNAWWLAVIAVVALLFALWLGWMLGGDGKGSQPTAAVVLQDDTPSSAPGHSEPPSQTNTRSLRDEIPLQMLEPVKEPVYVAHSPTESAAESNPQRAQPATVNEPDLVAAPAQSRASLEERLEAVSEARPVSEPSQNIPDYETLFRQGIKLPDIHLDLHVYSADPDKRFVFVNGKRYRQSQTTESGADILDINKEGAVLEYRGRQFLLRRQQY